MTENRYHWATPGDVNAFFGLMLDNVANLLLTAGLLAGVFGFPTKFVLQFMVPGTAIGVLVGDLIFTWMAFRLARKLNRPDVTAMPLGLDTPSTLGMIFFVLGPAFLYARTKYGVTDEMLRSPAPLNYAPVMQACVYTWQIGICSIFISGWFKLLCAAGSNWIRRVLPRAGLLGSLAAIALVLISFLPLLEVFHYPVVGMVSLAIILTTLVSRIQLPRKIPGALAALVVGTVVYYLMKWTGLLEPPPMFFRPGEGLLPAGWLSAFGFGWLGALADSIKYLPIVIPFALATVVGGIDCTESAAAAGDEYDTGQVIAAEGVATLIAAVCGGVIQSTPYIGHPAYKAMGGRAAYTLATALFIGSAGLLGYFGYLYYIIPQAVVLPILIFIGLEITAQSFHATPRQHYPALALACVPAMARLVTIYANQLLAATATKVDDLAGRLPHELQTMRMLSGGFIVTSLLWASALAAMIDRKLQVAGIYFVLCGAFSLLGVIHSPFEDERLFWPWAIGQLPHAAAGQTPLYVAAAYFAAAALLFAWGWWMSVSGEVELKPDAARREP